MTATTYVKIFVVFVAFCLISSTHAYTLKGYTLAMDLKHPFFLLSFFLDSAERKHSVAGFA